MNVRELKALLENYDDDQTVVLVAEAGATEVREVRVVEATWSVEPEWATDGIGGPVATRDAVAVVGV